MTRVAEVDVELQLDGRGGDDRLQGHPNPRVAVLLTDRPSPRRVRLEAHTVVLGGLDDRDVLDPPQNGIGVVGEPASEQIRIDGGASGGVGGQEHAAFQHEGTGVRAGGQPGKEPFERVQDEQFLGPSAFPPCAVLQVQVGASGRVRPASDLPSPKGPRLASSLATTGQSRSGGTGTTAPATTRSRASTANPAESAE